MVAQTTEAEVLGRRVQELTGPARRAAANPRASASRPPIRCAANSPSRRRPCSSCAPSWWKPRTASAPSIEALETERTALENQLKQSQAERDKLQNEILTLMKREVDATWATERMENAVLRERINDIAAEIARLTSVLEGAGLADRQDAGGRHPPRRRGGDGASRQRRRRPRPSTAAAMARARPTARAPPARSPTGCGPCNAAPRRCRSPPRLTYRVALAKRGAARLTPPVRALNPARGPGA